MLKLIETQWYSDKNSIIRCVQTIRNSTERIPEFAAKCKRVFISLNTHFSVLDEYTNVLRLPQ